MKPTIRIAPKVKSERIDLMSSTFSTSKNEVFFSLRFDDLEGAPGSRAAFLYDAQRRHIGVVVEYVEQEQIGWFIKLFSRDSEEQPVHFRLSSL